MWTDDGSCEQVWRCVAVPNGRRIRMSLDQAVSETNIMVYERRNEHMDLALIGNARSSALFPASRFRPKSFQSSKSSCELPQ